MCSLFLLGTTPRAASLQTIWEFPMAGWFYLHDEVQAGPVSTAQLRELAASGRLLPTDLVWREGIKDWIEARTVKDLLPGSVPPPPPKSASAPPPPPRPAIDAASSSPSGNTGTVVIRRKPSLTGWPYKIRVTVGGQFVGNIPGGILDVIAGTSREIRCNVPPGGHTVELQGGGLKQTSSVQSKGGQDTHYLTYFSNLGAMGGGLAFSEDASPRSSGSPARLVIFAGGGFLLLMMLCCGVLGQFGTSSHNVQSKEEFRQLVIGKTEQEVLAAVGKPTNTQDYGRDIVWYYQQCFRDPITGKWLTAQVTFENGRVDRVNF